MKAKYEALFYFMLLVAFFLAYLGVWAGAYGFGLLALRCLFLEARQ